MSDPNFIDFDAAFEERDTPPLKVRVLGEEWELPGMMPAALPLRIARMVADGREKDDLTSAEVMTLAMDVVPRDVLDAWLDKGLDIDKLGRIIENLTARYMGKAGALGEAEAPEAGATTGSPSSSSNDGASSSPTSPASTASTSPESSPA